MKRDDAEWRANWTRTITETEARREWWPYSRQYWYKVMEWDGVHHAGGYGPGSYFAFSPIRLPDGRHAGFLETSVASFHADLHRFEAEMQARKQARTAPAREKRWPAEPPGQPLVDGDATPRVWVVYRASSR